jgi:hypothetical protein
MGLRTTHIATKKNSIFKKSLLEDLEILIQKMKHYRFVEIYIIKEFVQPKISLNRDFLIWREREREGEG